MRIRCPKCDEPIPFEKDAYPPGQVLVFTCPSCNKQFKIRTPKAKAESNTENEAEEVASVVVVENAFHLRQVIPLPEGDNVIGRFVRGTKANAAFKTVDPSVDTTHCIINTKKMANGEYAYTLRDAQSNTGTFFMDHLLGNKERVRLSEGNIITIGATTLIFRENSNDGGED